MGFWIEDAGLRVESSVFFGSSTLMVEYSRRTGSSTGGLRAAAAPELDATSPEPDE